ncbi:MAG: hypothetical protein QOH10_729 [Actinomycetota bacterium]|nr:hypothetical protein [Actinomycetota bacterium]
MTESVGTDGVGIGTAIVSYIEPRAGAEREFNRWYERDHFPAAVMAGPGAYAGARFVAARECKLVRPDADLFGDPRAGSYLSIAWLLPDAQPAWDEWVADQMEMLRAQGRMFAGRDHLHTAVYGYSSEVRSADGPPASLALDRRYPGVVAVALTDEDDDAERWAGALVGEQIPLVVALRRQRLLVSVLGEPAPHLLLLAFVDGDVIDTWHRRVAPALAGRSDVGFAGPFLATDPGTDTYVDRL